MSCPIVRDTKTVPCWLAEYDGELYYLGIQTDISADFDPPYLGHRVLVEGVVKDAPRICGGIVLEPVAASPLPELDATCNTILPAEDRYQVPFAPRPPGPSGGRLAFDPPPGGARPAAPERAGPQDFALEYDFDTAVMGRHSGTLTQIFNYAQKTNARRIRITGHRGASLLSDGSTMTERAELAEIRARETAKLLVGAGLDAASLDVSWSSELEAAGWRRRLARPPHDRSSRALSEPPRDARYSWRTLAAAVHFHAPQLRLAPIAHVTAAVNLDGELRDLREIDRARAVDLDVGGVARVVVCGNVAAAVDREFAALGLALQRRVARAVHGHLGGRRAFERARRDVPGAGDRDLASARAAVQCEVARARDRSVQRRRGRHFRVEVAAAVQPQVDGSVFREARAHEHLDRGAAAPAAPEVAPVGGCRRSRCRRPARCGSSRAARP